MTTVADLTAAVLAAQADLDDVIVAAKAKGLSHRSSRRWAHQLGVVINLRNALAAAEKSAGSRKEKGWGAKVSDVFPQSA
jgi:D-serine deaminase-like pyridoxal phosphate-dependent protein